MRETLRGGVVVMVSRLPVKGEENHAVPDVAGARQETYHGWQACAETPPESMGGSRCGDRSVPVAAAGQVASCCSILPRGCVQKPAWRQ